MKERNIRILAGFCVLLALYIISTFNYLLFHSLSEFFSILVASGIFVVAWNARRFIQNRYFLLVGIAYLSLALLYVMHLMTHEGLNVIPGLNKDQPTQIEIATRYVQGISLLTAPLFIRRRFPAGWVLLGYMAVVGAILLSIFIWPVFPSCYAEGQGITVFKRMSEYLSCAFLFASIVLLLRERKAFDRGVLHLMVGSIGVAALSGIFLTSPMDARGEANLWDHLAGVVSFYLMYRAVILTSFLKPYNLLFRELKSREAELIQTQAELERRVSERTRELAQATEVLKSEMAKRIASQEALAEERNRLKQIMDSMEVGVCIITGDHEIEYMNPTLERELGKNQGKPCYHYFNGFDAPCHWCKRNTVNTGKSVRWEWHSVASGKTFEFFDMPLYRGDGSVSKLKIIQDITEQYRVREALRESEERYRRIVETAAEGILVLDADGRTGFVNGRMAEILGYGVGEMLDVHFFDFMDEEGRKVAEAALERQRKGACDWTDFRFLRKTGEAVWCLVSASPILNGAGEYAGALIMATDLTERIRLEGQLRESQKMEAIGTLAGGIAHDFNNILAAMIGFTEMALDHCDDDDPKKIRLNQVLKAGLRGRELVKQILTFSRRGEQQMKTVRLAPLATEAIGLLSASLPATIQIDQRIDGHSPPVLADPTQMHQVIMNVCSNAVYAMREKGGTLSVMVGEAFFGPTDPLPHPGLAPGRYACLSISDTGTGMTPEVRERIFEPFFSTKPSAQGTGLGLSVTYGIVKRHQGVVCVTSEPGKGSVFDIFLPALPSSPATDEGTDEAVSGDDLPLSLDRKLQNEP